MTGIKLGNNDLSGANFAGQNLTGAADGPVGKVELQSGEPHSCRPPRCKPDRCEPQPNEFVGCRSRRRNFASTGITPDQLYTTADYQAHDLTRIGLLGDDLSGANFVDQHLVSANFYAAKLIGADLTNADLTNATLANADFTQAKLANANLSGVWAINANFSYADLSKTNLTGVNLTGSYLMGANVRRAHLGAVQDYSWGCIRAAWGGCLAYGYKPNGFSGGIALAQLNTTASSQDRDLSGTDLTNVNLVGDNFAGFNLTDATFSGATLGQADLSGADTRGATGLNSAGALLTNLIRPDGHVSGVDLGVGKTLTVRDYDGNPTAAIASIAITVDQHFTMSSGGALQMLFEADAWDSTISFASGIPVSLGGSLELGFSADVNLLSQIGRTFNVFDWTGVSPTGALAVSSPYVWDLSNLYSTGQITFLAANGLAGDFNGDNMVDAADYAVWRHGLGPNYKQAAYDVWKNHFGVNFGPGSGAVLPSVPEPNAFILFTLGIVAMFATRHSRRAVRLHTNLRAFWRRHSPECTFLAVVAIQVIPSGLALADAPTVGLTKIGVPSWKPVDFQLFSAPAAPFPAEFNNVYDTLAPFDGPSAGVYTPHAPPYDTELSTAATAAGYVNRSVFDRNAIILQPNAVYFAFMLLPDPGIIGSSRLCFGARVSKFCLPIE